MKTKEKNTTLKGGETTRFYRVKGACTQCKASTRGCETWLSVRTIIWDVTIVIVVVREKRITIGNKTRSLIFEMHIVFVENQNSPQKKALLFVTEMILLFFSSISGSFFFNIVDLGFFI